VLDAEGWTARAKDALIQALRLFERKADITAADAARHRLSHLL
jgi:hypothetical protein